MENRRREKIKNKKGVEFEIVVPEGMTMAST